VVSVTVVKLDGAVLVTEVAPATVNEPDVTVPVTGSLMLEQLC